MPQSSDFAHANIDEIVEALTLPEAIDLTAGVGFWNTAAIPRLGVPAIRVSNIPSLEPILNPCRYPTARTA